MDAGEGKNTLHSQNAIDKYSVALLFPKELEGLTLGQRSCLDNGEVRSWWRSGVSRWGGGEDVAQGPYQHVTQGLFACLMFLDMISSIWHNPSQINLARLCTRVTEAGKTTIEHWG